MPTSSATTTIIAPIKPSGFFVARLTKKSAHAEAAVRPRGRVVLVSGHDDASGVDLTRIVWSEALVTGSNCYGISGMETDFDDAIDLIASGRVEATKLVSHRLPFDDIAEAFRISADKTRGAIKVHVVQE